MKLKSLAVVVALCAGIGLSSAADATCKYRKARGLLQHWPHPMDCSRFYRCSSRGVKSEVVCASPKIYNPRTGKCVKKRRGLCRLSMLSPLAGEDNMCAASVDGTYVPDSGYCRNFYICQDRQAYPQTCSSGSYFNTTMQNCNPDDNRSCWQNLCINSEAGSYLANEISCTSFYICADKEAVLQSCPKGSYFNTRQSNCEPDPNENLCWENLCLSKSDGIFLPDSESCKDYYVCYQSKPIKQTCPESSYFSVKDRNCIPGDCSDSTTEQPSTETTENSSGVTYDTTDSSSGESNETTDSNGEESCDTTEASTEEPCDTTEPPTGEPCDITEPPTEEPCDSTESTTEQPCETTQAATEEPCDTTDAPTEEPCDSTESPTEEPCDTTEPPTEEPCDSTELPTEEPCDPTELPTEEPCDSTEPPTEDVSDTTETAKTNGDSAKQLSLPLKDDSILLSLLLNNREILLSPPRTKPGMPLSPQPFTKPPSKVPWNLAVKPPTEKTSN